MKTQVSTKSRRGNANGSIRIVCLTMTMVSLIGTIPGQADQGDRNRPVPELPSPDCDVVNAPAGARLTSHVYAAGVQIYRWTGTAWTFIAPEATLFADPCYEREVGVHYAGPTWAGTDGSTVVGTRLNGCTPTRGALPWLLLGALSSSNHGRFGHVDFIQRLNTIGGNAPSEAGAFVGDEARVPYTAEYYFYRTAKR